MWNVINLQRLTASTQSCEEPSEISAGCNSSEISIIN